MDIIFIFWLLDIFNFSFMAIFDTVYAINTGAWMLIWFVMIMLSDTNKKK